MVDWTKNWKTDLVRHALLEKLKQKHKRWEKRQNRNRQDQQQSGRYDVVEEEAGKWNMSFSLSDIPVLEPLVLSQWSWPIPLGRDMNQSNLLHVGPEKGFASLMAVANDDQKMMTKKWWPKNDDQGSSNAGNIAISSYLKTAMVNVWQQNFNIVFESEELDRISHPNNSEKNAREILLSILSILPWDDSIETIQALMDRGKIGTVPSLVPGMINSSSHNTMTQRKSIHLQDLEAVIVYRAPRVHHLRSLWYQVGGQNLVVRCIFDNNIGKPKKETLQVFSTHWR
jgi:hypothetical protein